MAMIMPGHNISMLCSAGFRVDEKPSVRLLDIQAHGSNTTAVEGTSKDDESLHRYGYLCLGER